MFLEYGLTVEETLVELYVNYDQRDHIECVRSCDQKPYLHNERKGGICIKIESNLQKNISLLQHGRRFFVYSSNMAAVTSCEHSIYFLQKMLLHQ